MARRMVDHRGGGHDGRPVIAVTLIGTIVLLVGVTQLERTAGRRGGRRRPRGWDVYDGIQKLVPVFAAVLGVLLVSRACGGPM